jgi:hypothetical protein
MSYNHTPFRKVASFATVVGREVPDGNGLLGIDAAGTSDALV